VSERNEGPGGVVSEVVVIVDAARLWPPLLIRGVLSVIFGVVALVWPGVTVLALALLFGVWALLQGVSYVVGAVRQARAHVGVGDWLPLLVIGLLGVAAAVATVLWPAITALVLTVMVGLFLVVVGVSELVMAVRLRRAIRGELFLVVAATLALLTGLSILLWPQVGIVVLTVVLGSYALVTGLLVIVAALRVRGLARGGRSGLDRKTPATEARPLS
jgi:uncharacterized membrane protein HdeD (DUF308 family)